MESVDFLLGNVDKEGQLEDDEVVSFPNRLTTGPSRDSGRRRQSGVEGLFQWRF